MPALRPSLFAAALALGVLGAGEPAAPLLARYEGPVLAESFTSVDTEPRFACDGDIDTVWNPGDRKAALRIDLGGSVPVGGWRLAATLTTPLAWEGREPWKPAPGYEVLASDDGMAWRQLAKPARGDGRIRSGQRVEHQLAEPATTRWLEIRIGDLGGLIDLEILAADGSIVPSFARARTCAGLRTRLRALGWSARYAGKAAAWAREHGLGVPAADGAPASEAAALDAQLAAATHADDAQVARWQAQTADLERRITGQAADADAWCDLLLRQELCVTAGSRVAAMGQDANATAPALAAMRALADDRDPARQAEFNRLRTIVDDAWQDWSARHHASVVRDGRWWVRADGRRLVPFGLNYVQIGLIPSLANPSLIRRTTPVMNEPSEREFRNLRLWGFNSVRLAIRLGQLNLDPRTGELSEAGLARIRQILAWALRYDIHAVIDLHLDYGPPPMAPHDGEAYTQNHIAMLPYYTAAWRAIAMVCRDQPHVIAYELIANEPNIARGLFFALRERHTDSWHDTGQAIDAWHAFLAGRHGSVEAAGAFWGLTTRSPQENATLRAGDGQPVLDPVALAQRFPDLDPEANTRLRDYLLASQEIYLRQYRAMADAIRAVDPHHLTTFSVNYDLARANKANRVFGADCRLLYDQRPAEAVGITDHYSGIGMAQRYRATGQPWFAGENWIYDGSTAEFARMLAAGGGNIGWAHWPSDHHFEGAIGHDLWLKEKWLGWTRAAWFSDNLRRGDIPTATVALIAPLMAYDQAMRRLPRLLERMDVAYDILIDETVARDPAILGRYQAVVMDLDRASIAAVRAVLAAPVPALFTNRQLVDGDNRWGAGNAPALAGTFYHPDRLPAPPPAAADPPPISLAGTWNFRTDPQAAGDAGAWQALTAFPGWDSLPAPGYWESESISQGRYATYDGVAWYAREIAIPAAFRGRDLVFTAVIDDVDTAWFNGTPIGSTDHATPGYWTAPRRYRVPAALVRLDQPNRLVIRVTDEKGRGGIAPGIVQIGVEDRDDRRLTWGTTFGGLAAGTVHEIAVARDLPRLTDAGLAPGCTALARFADGTVAVARAGRHLLWLGGDGVSFGGDNGHPGTEEGLLAAHLQAAGVAAVWPVTPASDQLEVHRLADFMLIENRSSKACRLDPATLAGGRPISWVRVVAPPYRLREAAGEIEIPPGGFAGVVWAGDAPK